MIDASTNTPKGNGKIMQCSIATDCMRLPLHPTSIVKKVMKPMDIAFLTYFFDSLQMKEEVPLRFNNEKTMQSKLDWISNSD